QKIGSGSDLAGQGLGQCEALLDPLGSLSLGMAFCLIEFRNQCCAARTHAVDQRERNALALAILGLDQSQESSCCTFSACLNSVRSRVTLPKPSRIPRSSRNAVIETLAQKREPSLRTRQPSCSTLPFSSAVFSSRSGRPRSTSSRG